MIDDEDPVREGGYDVRKFVGLPGIDHRLQMQTVPADARTPASHLASASDRRARRSAWPGWRAQTVAMTRPTRVAAAGVS